MTNQKATVLSTAWLRSWAQHQGFQMLPKPGQPLVNSMTPCKPHRVLWSSRGNESHLERLNKIIYTLGARLTPLDSRWFAALTASRATPCAEKSPPQGPFSGPSPPGPLFTVLWEHVSCWGLRVANPTDTIIREEPAPLR